MKLTDVERDWCEENPDVLDAIAGIHEEQGELAALADYVDSANYHFRRAEELWEYARAIRESWED